MGRKKSVGRCENFHHIPKRELTLAGERAEAAHDTNRIIRLKIIKSESQLEYLYSKRLKNGRLSSATPGFMFLDIQHTSRKNIVKSNLNCFL